MVKTYKVKVDPKNFKAICGILPDKKLIQGDAIELELTKREIIRCMNYAEVFDLSTGDEVLIDELSVKELEEYVTEDTDDGEDTEETVDVASASIPAPVQRAAVENKNVNQKPQQNNRQQQNHKNNQRQNEVKATEVVEENK